MNSATPTEPRQPWWGDWSQYFCPGPRRKFTAAEMARAGNQPWPRGVDQYVGISMIIIGSVQMLLAPGPWDILLMFAVIGTLSLLALWTSRQLWRSPTRLRLNLSTQFGSLLYVALLLGTMQLESLDKTQRLAITLALSIVFMMAITAWWFMVIFRVQQIEARLRELDEQEAKLALQRRLATAQIHPHFVFNTLASLTHWVETQDARAAPLLREFNAYLRATLPMFERESQSLREELELVRHYLAIMQARLGERLRWTVSCDGALDLQLPPGSLLTLAENAITHGIEPSLRGGSVSIRCEREAGRLRLIVEDSGEGLNEPFTEGLGLKNTRERLLALHPDARLQLAALPAGGCIATMEIPA